MEDILTEAPPPSRFFNEDLNNFASPSPPVPSPFLLLSNPKKTLIHPSLLIIAISPPSLHLLRHFLSSKILIGSLILPETRFSGTTVDASPEKSCNIYAVDDQASVVLVSVQCPVAEERAHAVAKLLVGGEKIRPEKVLILGSVQSRNFRGKLSSDEALGFKLETTEQRVSEPLIKGLDYFPSGSVIDGLEAALLSQCQLRRVKGTLFVSWPVFGGSAVAPVRSVVKAVLPEVEFGSCGELGFDRIKGSSPFDSELYT